MSIEHKLIPAGEQHVVANWQVATVPDLDNLSVTFDDIGKQAWVQGVGHFTLANSDPITWEAASSTLASFSYNAGTKVLTITDSTGAAYTATIDGQNAAQVAALIAAHSAAADPHGDRAYSDAELAAYALTVTSALSGKQAADATLTALAAFNTNGSLHQTAADTFVARTLTAGTGISITDGDGVAGNPTVTCTLDVSAKLTTADVIPDQLISGLLPAAGVLANTISAGVAYVQGARVSVPLTNRTWTANRDTYVDLSSAGVYTYVEVANGAGVPAVTALHMRVAKVVSGASTLGAITMLKAPVTSYGTGSGANIYGANNTLLGKALAPIATTAYGNTIVGDTQCAALSTGYENVVIGAATPVLDTGYHNVVIGTGAGNALTTSKYNVLIGYEAGAANSTILNGIVAIGSGAARHSTGAQITAIGQSAGGANTTGLRWTAIGDSSGSTATASDWTAVGSGAITGNQGISIGSYAGLNTAGAGNVSIGYNAGRTSAYDSFSAESISIGLAASYQSVRGYGSIAIGTRAGSGTVANHKSTSDSYAIYIGWEASRSSAVPTATGLSNVIAIGTNAEVASSNSCVIGAAASPYKVGINMTTPTAKLHLPAGSTSASSAPIKLTTGALLTTPEAGTFEFLSPNLYFTGVSTRWNFGDASFIATTESNTLSGTRTRILGGSSNTVSGTDNVAIGCFSTTLDGIGQIVLGASASARLKCNDITVLGASQGGCTNVKHFLYKGGLASCYLSNAFGQANSATPDITNCPRAALSSLPGVSLFELRFVSNGYDYNPTFVGSISGCRVFSVHLDGGGVYTVSAVATPYADMATGGVGISFAITVITAVGGEKLLQIIPTVSGSGVLFQNNYATLDAIYQW